MSPERRGRARIYGERERVRIKLILRGKRLGLSLAEIGELLDLYEVARNERAQLAKFLALLEERRARLLQQKEDIDAVLAEIDGVERECRRRLRDERPAPARPAVAGVPAGSQAPGLTFTLTSIRIGASSAVPGAACPTPPPAPGRPSSPPSKGMRSGCAPRSRARARCG